MVRFGDTPVHDFLAEIQTEENSRVASELPKETSFEYTNQSLSDVVGDVSFRHAIPLAFNGRVLDDAGINPNSPVSASFRGVPLFAALCIRLAPDESHREVVLPLVLADFDDRHNSRMIEIGCRR